MLGPDRAAEPNAQGHIRRFSQCVAGRHVEASHGLTWTGLSPAGSHQLAAGALLDHLVGERKHVIGHREIHCLCGFQIDDEKVSCRDLDRQISRFCALENPRT